MAESAKGVKELDVLKQLQCML